MRNRFAFVAVALAFGATAFAQDAAPRETVSASVGGKKLSIEYGQPSLKGRTLDSLIAQLPEDRVWRAGVDQVTTLTTEGPVTIGGKKVPAGKYSLYVQAPATGDWSLIVNSDLGIPLIKLWDKAPPNLANAPWPHLEGYSNIAAKEVARAAMKAGATDPPSEQFTMKLAPSGKGATLTLAWADRSWATDILP
jgi:Protein of unknown function (DUF2911)